MKKTLIAAGAAITLSLLSTQAFAGELSNGVQPNGITYNGIPFNGISFNGIGLNGIGLNGIGLNGIGLNGARVNGAKLSGATGAGGDTVCVTDGSPVCEQTVTLTVRQVTLPNGVRIPVR